MSQAAGVRPSLPRQFAVAPPVAPAVSGTLWPLTWPAMTSVVVLAVLTVPTSVYRLPVELPFGLDVYRLAVMALLVLWFGALLTDPRVRWQPTPLSGPLTAIFAVIGVSLWSNLSVLASGFGYESTIKRLLYFGTLALLFCALVSTVRSERDARRLVTLVIGTGVVIAAFGVVERFTTFNIFQHLDAFIPFLKHVADDPGAVLTRAGGVRVSGSAAHPIAFAAILGMIEPLALMRLSVAEGFWKQLGYAAAAGLIAVTMILTGSRTAFTAFLAAGLVIALGVRQGRGRLLAVVVFAFFFVYMAAPGVLGTLLKWMTPSFIMQQEVDNPAGRLADYSRIMAYVREQPLLGMGFGVFTPERFFYVDNQYLKFLVETGVAGLVSYAWLLVGAVVWFFRSARKASPRVAADLLGVAASVAVFTAVNATFDTLGFPQVTHVYFILLGVGAALAMIATAPVSGAAPAGDRR